MTADARAECGEVRRSAHQARENMSTVNENLTLEDFDWLRKLRAATDAKRDSPPVPTVIGTKLCQFGCIAPTAPRRFAITERGRDALLEQRMRDAEER